MKIIGVYKITNTVTGKFYIGSSKDVKRRWAQHKSPSRWNEHPNNPMYLDMKKYGVEKFDFEVLEVLEVVEPEELKDAEQKFIKTLKPAYNNINAKGLNIERKKKTQKECSKEYRKTEKYKEYQKSDKRKKAKKEYQNQLCCYNGETLTLNALYQRFRRAGIEHPIIEAKKYLLNK